MSTFFALDVETANVDRSSICQIGLVLFKDGQEEYSWSTLVNPECEFDDYNVAIHGIDKDDVCDAPKYNQIHDALSQMVDGEIIVHHSSFDRTAFNRRFARSGVESFSCSWLDNTAVVRRVWKDFARKGYSLKNLSNHFQIPLTHHDALSDARAAGIIFSKALVESGTNPNDWLSLSKKPITPNSSGSVARDGKEGGLFFGENIVFTGTLAEERAICAERAANVGFTVQNGVTKKTSYLCVGIQDPTVLAGHSKSSKHRKAEKYINEGQDLAIISEEDFWDMIKVEYV